MVQLAQARFYLCPLSPSPLAPPPNLHVDVVKNYLLHVGGLVPPEPREFADNPRRHVFVLTAGSVKRLSRSGYCFFRGRYPVLRRENSGSITVGAKEPPKNSHCHRAWSVATKDLPISPRYGSHLRCFISIHYYSKVSGTINNYSTVVVVALLVTNNG